MSAGWDWFEILCRDAWRVCRQGGDGSLMDVAQECRPVVAHPLVGDDGRPITYAGLGEVGPIDDGGRQPSRC